MSHTLSVSILDREYRLRVNREEDAVLTARIAEYVDQKMRAFRQAHPDRPEATTAVITALAIAEDMFLVRERVEHMLDTYVQEANMRSINCRSLHIYYNVSETFLIP